MPFAIVGSTEEIRTLLCGEQQHDEHCRGWRWHLYTRDSEQRWQNVMVEVRKMQAERREREAMFEAAE